MSDFQVQIWASEGHPLKQSEWEAVGFASLESYVKSLIEEGKRGLQTQGKPVHTFDNLPVASFGLLHSDGQKEVLLEVETLEELPDEDIEGVLVFDKPIDVQG